MLLEGRIRHNLEETRQGAECSLLLPCATSGVFAMGNFEHGTTHSSVDVLFGLLNDECGVCFEGLHSYMAYQGSRVLIFFFWLMGCSSFFFLRSSFALFARMVSIVIFFPGSLLNSKGIRLSGPFYIFVSFFFFEMYDALQHPVFFLSRHSLLPAFAYRGCSLNKYPGLEIYGWHNTLLSSILFFCHSLNMFHVYSDDPFSAMTLPTVRNEQAVHLRSNPCLPNLFHSTLPFSLLQGKKVRMLMRKPI